MSIGTRVLCRKDRRGCSLRSYPRFFEVSKRPEVERLRVDRVAVRLVVRLRIIIITNDGTVNRWQTLLRKSGENGNLPSINNLLTTFGC